MDLMGSSFFNWDMIAKIPSVYQQKEKGSNVKIASVENGKYIGYEFPHYNYWAGAYKESTDPKEEECFVL